MSDSQAGAASLYLEDDSRQGHPQRYRQLAHRDAPMVWPATRRPVAKHATKQAACRMV